MQIIHKVETVASTVAAPATLLGPKTEEYGYPDALDSKATLSCHQSLLHSVLAV
jgi:hypothetical protein